MTAFLRNFKMAAGRHLENIGHNGLPTIYLFEAGY